MAAPKSVEVRLHTWLESATPAPVSVILFGSFTRHDGDSSSDVGVLIVRPDVVDPEGEEWEELRTSLAQHLERWCGNECQIVDLSLAEIQEAHVSEQPLVASLLAGGHCVFGSPLEELSGGRSSMQLDDDGAGQA